MARKHEGGKFVTAYSPEYAKVAERLVASGFAVKDLAYALDVSATTIQNWKKEYPEFKKACECGKKVMKKKLVAEGLKMALGYDYKSSKTVTKKDRKTGEEYQETTEFIQHQAGNDRMLTFMLLNIDRQLGDNEWETPTQRTQIEQKTMQVKITGEVASSAIEKLAGKLLDEPPRKKIESKVIENED